MNVQLIIVGVCILAALLFMGRKFLNTFRRKGGCSCEAACKGANRCFCEGNCPENQASGEIRPKK